MISWTVSMMAELRRLAATGLSRAEIAHALSAAFPERISRNAVIGKLRRLGVQRLGRFRRQPSRPPIVKRDAAALAAATAAVATEIPGGVPGGLALVQLGHGDCRWPIDDPG